MQNLTLTDAQNDAVKVVRIVGGCFTFAGALLMIGAIVFFGLYRLRRERLVLMLSISAFLGSFSYMAGNMDFALGPCLWQAFWESFFDWAIILWVVCIAIDTLLTVLKRGEVSPRLEGVYHVVVWVWSLVFSLLPFANASDGFPVYGDSGSWCWIRRGAEFTPWRWGLLYAWLFIFWVVVAVCYVVSFVKVRRAEKDLSDDLQRSVRRMLIFPIIFVLCWFFSLVNRAHQGAGNAPNFGLVVLQALLSSLQGFINALAYFLNKDMRQRIMGCRREKPVEPKEYVAKPSPSTTPKADGEFMDVPLDNSPVPDPFASSDED